MYRTARFEAPYAAIPALRCAVGAETFGVPHLSAALFDHVADGDLRSQQSTGEVGVHDRFYVFVRRLPQRFAFDGHAGVVDPHVDAAERFDCGVPETLKLTSVGNAARRPTNAVGAELLLKFGDDGIDRVGCPTADGDGTAPLQELPGQTVADATGAAL